LEDIWDVGQSVALVQVLLQHNTRT